ncbi:MAG: hypothetical protein FWC65_02665 [Treponema sp.]|nr:hypothetical protein [Treponema sp.]
MVTYISKKASWLRCLVSFLPAAAVAALLCAFLAGPRLGLLYDFLLGWRAPPVSREILLIDSFTDASMSGWELGNDILEPGAASSLLYTMAELGARTLIIQVPILGLPAGGSVGEAEILHHFDEEFSLLSRNIRNLFDAIRIGSIAPADAAQYVGTLVELSEMGKERLVAALVRRDEESISRMENAAAFFGNARRPGDLRVQLIMAGDGGRPGVLAQRYEYSQPRPDRDGVLRRIAPVLNIPHISEDDVGERTLEHIIYGALKYRLEPYGIADLLPLDQSGAVLVEIPRRDGFRRISISDFLAYEETDRELRRLIAEGEAFGIFQNIAGENRPGFLFDYALALRYREGEHKQEWIAFRNRYFESLQIFLDGPTEMNMVRGFEEIVVALDSEAGIAQVLEMRDSLRQMFAALRAKHSEVMEIRQRLESALLDSFCILGNPAETEASALLANSIITRQAVHPGEERYLLWSALVFALLACFFVKSLGPASTLGVGALLTLFAALVFSVGFILSGHWFDPQVPAAASAVGAAASFVWALAAKTRYTRRFRAAYGSIVSRPCLKSVLLAGKPLPSQIMTVKAAVVAIKKLQPVSREIFSDRRASSQELIAFQEKASELARKAGGTIIGTDGDMVTACFGSPLERVFLGGKKYASLLESAVHTPAALALQSVDFASHVARIPECDSWYFGVHMGNCTFAWTALSGYFALGVPVIRAKMLSRLADRYQSRIVISASVSEALPDMVGKKLGILKDNDGTEKEHFYRLADSG